MLGLGESKEEVIETMKDLRGVGRINNDTWSVLTAYKKAFGGFRVYIAKAI